MKIRANPVAKPHMEQNPKILLIDDNPINIRVAAKILRTRQYNISFSLSGREGLQKAQSVDFDLILLDIMMPEMDGYEVCRILKNDSRTRNVPVIFLTAKTEPENVVKAFELGGADYVTKPFNGKELLSRVETHIRLKQWSEELKTTNRKLREANDTKDKMFSIISHDLLGPFGNIRESLEMIANEEVTMDEVSMQKFVKAMWQSINTAYSLLENLLYWARSQQGRMVYKPGIINADEVVQETFALLRGMAGHKKICLHSEGFSGEKVFADKNAMKTILRNLVSNALKFTEPGGEVTVKFTDQNNEFVRISVIDTGIGMNKEVLQQIFKKYKSDPRWGTRGEKGVGLGLVITREFVEKQGGEIWVESHENQGSKFHFTLPKTDLAHGK